MMPDDSMIPIFQESDLEEISPSDLPDTIALLPLRNMVLFPGVIIPISVGRPKSLQLIREAYKKKQFIGVVAQNDSEIDDPSGDDLYQLGTLAHIFRILEMPDDSTTVIIQGKQRFVTKKITDEKPYLRAKVDLKEDIWPPKAEEKAFEALVASLKDMALSVIKLSNDIPPEAAFAVKNIESPAFLVNFIGSNSDMSLPDKQAILELDLLQQRANELLEYLTHEVQKLQLQDDIQTKVKTELDQQQREYFLSQQMKTIRDELGGYSADLEIEDLKERAKSKKWDKSVADVFKREVEKLERINPASPDYSNQLIYLRTLLDLPWNEYTKDKFDLKRAERTLNKDHYGLDDVKERILEHLAVLKLKGDLKAPILCLHGPPGVGKTSLGKSIAKALGRKYVRMSLGGLHDEAEIRGHRKTYIGALPGRIIQNIKKAKSSNPVFVLDEVDKIGADFRGDPSYALLEVLDPEQNDNFYDNYLEVEYDLSKVLFVATANMLNTINPALRDRMELIEVTGYSIEEKVEIAKKHLVPKLLKAHGLKGTQLKFSKKVLELIVEEYTRESGVRALEKQLAKVIRRITKKIGMDEAYRVSLTVEDAQAILGRPHYRKNQYQGNADAGVVTGLAWTSAGGTITQVETSLSKAKGSRLVLTGNLGEVMKESAMLALEFIRSHAGELNLDPEIFERWGVHVHVPEGAIPKDGPSAGITMLTSITSAFTQRKVRLNVAMTGEITLRGRVLPVGGIKEKILAAKRAGIKTIILSQQNQKDVEEVNPLYLKGVEFFYVNTAREVLDKALLQQKVERPLEIK